MPPSPLDPWLVSIQDGFMEAARRIRNTRHTEALPQVFVIDVAARDIAFVPLDVLMRAPPKQWPRLLAPLVEEVPRIDAVVVVNEAWLAIPTSTADSLARMAAFGHGVRVSEMPDRKEAIMCRLETRGGAQRLLWAFIEDGRAGPVEEVPGETTGPAVGFFAGRR